jgi:hypothetical protein
VPAETDPDARPDSGESAPESAPGSGAEPDAGVGRTDSAAACEAGGSQPAG